jgi:3-phosphoglycerate kinase
VEEEKKNEASAILKKIKEKNIKLVLPLDHLIAQEVKENTEIKQTQDATIPSGWKGVDIGDKTIAEAKNLIRDAKTIVWNGPMGIFELESFSKGTKEIAESIAETDALSIAGGGDSVSAIEKFNLTDKFSHISTGGGASLEFLEGKELPGVAAIPDRK